jgi:hypothetical protein
VATVCVEMEYAGGSFRCSLELKFEFFSTALTGTCSLRCCPPEEVDCCDEIFIFILGSTDLDLNLGNCCSPEFLRLPVDVVLRRRLC